MKKFLLAFLVSLSAHAECPPSTSTPRQPMAFNEEQGIWFSLPVAKCMLLDLSELRVAKERADLLSRRGAVQESSIQLLHESLQIEEAKSAKLKEAFEAAAKENASLRPAWYEHPIFLLTTGAMLGAITTIGIAYALK